MNICGSGSDDCEEDDETYGGTSSNQSSISNGMKNFDVRNHLIERVADGKARRCKHCHKHTTQICKRCNVHLHAKCFSSYEAHKN